MYVCLYVCMYIYIYIYVCISLSLHIYIYTKLLLTHSVKCMYVYLYVYIYIYIHIDLSLSIYIYIYIHIVELYFVGESFSTTSIPETFSNLLNATYFNHRIYDIFIQHIVHFLTTIPNFKDSV